MVGAARSDGSCFKIDARTVTRGEWHAWGQTVPSGLLQADELGCYEAASVEPTYYPSWLDPDGWEILRGSPCDYAWGPGNPSPEYPMPWPPTGAELQRPMYCVTWCQAAVYCREHGKRLCSGVVPDEPQQPFHRYFAEPATSEWFAACSAAGTRPYPYGTGPVEGTCWDPEVRKADEEDTQAWYSPDAHPQCEGGYTGLRMMGVLPEWTAHCSAEYPDARGETDGRSCVVAGGEWYCLPFAQPECADGARRANAAANRWSCAKYNLSTKHITPEWYGREDARTEAAFRCCSD